MKQSIIKSFNQQKLTQDEISILRNQLSSLQSVVDQKYKENNDLKLELDGKNNIIAQLNREINTDKGNNSSLLSSKDKEISDLKSQISLYQQTLLSTQNDSKQKDEMIQLLFKTVDELKIEKKELQEKNNKITESFFAAQKNNDPLLDILSKSLAISEFPESNKSELVESKLLAENSFSILENDDN